MRDRGDFHTSSYCTGGTCIGVAVGDEIVEVADLPAGETTLRVTREQWAAFVAGVKNGEFDLS